MELPVARFEGVTEKIATFGSLHGSRTCGCVAMFLWGRECLTYQQKSDGLTAWPMCPWCQGTGVDSRSGDVNGAR